MKSHIQGIDHVMITVGDLDVARGFYEGILGLEEMECPVKDGQRVWYKIGDQQLHVNLQKKYHKAGFCHFAIAIEADKYHEYAKMVSNTDYKLSVESQKFEDEVYRFFLDDPFSNTVEVHQAYRNAYKRMNLTIQPVTPRAFALSAPSSLAGYADVSKR